LKIAVMQPTFNPWMGYFDLINSVDLFVFLDTVQLAKRSWQTRNRLKINDREHIISIPIKKEVGRDKTRLINAKIANRDWAQKSIKSIEMSYKKANYFNSVFSFVKDLLLDDATFLSTYNSGIIKRVCSAIGISTEFIYSSQLGKLSGSKDRLLFNICKKVEADTYVSPRGSLSYLAENNAGEYFLKENIALYYHNYEHPIYPQVGKIFLPYMGIVDLLLNVGIESAKEVIVSGHKDEIFYKDLRL